MKERIAHFFEFPLFQALARRRTRRVGLGYNLDDGTFSYRSTAEPVPLTELETAILAWAAHGTNGMALGEAQVATGVHSTWNGRTHPAACNDPHAFLMIVNDDGVFVYDPPDATSIVEITGIEDAEKIVASYRKGLRRLNDKPPAFTEAAWIKANLWMTEKPGATLFFPVVDVSAEYINVLLSDFERERLRIIDENTGQWAGVGRWVQSGMLNGPEVTMRFVELGMLNTQVSIGHYMAQNLALACEAIGIGHVTFGGLVPLVVLGGSPFTRGLGLRFITGKDGMPNPVGLDGILEGHCPPYFETMDEAVQDIFDIRYGSQGILSSRYRGPTPLKDWDTFIEGARPVSEEAVQAVKAYCTYVYDTYGRFPGIIDTIQLPIGCIAHHLDLDFYDEYYPSDALTDAHRRHMAIWHGE